MTERMSDALTEISRRTLSHYNGRAESFWDGTRDHDVSQNIEALLDALEGAPPHRILDFGCGPGRDVAAFAELGHLPIGLDGTEAFCAMATDFTDREIWQQDFLALDLPPERFDGIFANASLFHVPTSALPRVLSELYESLAPGGVLFSSNPRGANVEGWNGERFAVLHDLEGWTQYVTDAGFTPIGHYYRPSGLPREEQPWLASTWRKTNV